MNQEIPTIETEVPITLLSGYLGAGKTTLVNDILKRNKGLSITLLVNDFGDINIDQQLIKSQNERLIALTNGCVCCAIKDDLVSTLMTLPEPGDAIVIEASGVTNLSKLKKIATNLPGFSYAAAVTLYDLTEINRLLRDKYVKHAVREQLDSADYLIETKADLLSNSEAKDRRSQLQKESIAETLTRADFLAQIETRLCTPATKTMTKTVAANRIDEEHLKVHNSLWIPSAEIDTRALRQILQQRPTGLERVKGFIREGSGWLEIQYSTSGLSENPTEYVSLEFEGLQCIATDEFDLQCFRRSLLSLQDPVTF